MATEYDVVSAFSPMAPDGYGICYNPQKRRILFGVSSFKSSHGIDVTKFTVKLFEAMRQMKNILKVSP